MIELSSNSMVKSHPSLFAWTFPYPTRRLSLSVYISRLSAEHPCGVYGSNPVSSFMVLFSPVLNMLGGIWTVKGSPRIE